MKILRRKLRRDLRRQRAQFLAIAVTIFLGVTLFGASYDAYRNLEASYEQAFVELRFANLTTTGGDTKAIAAAARKADGVAHLATRVQADIPFQVDDIKLTGRIVGMPTVEQPRCRRPSYDLRRPTELRLLTGRRLSKRPHHCGSVGLPRSRAVSYSS